MGLVFGWLVGCLSLPDIAVLKVLSKGHVLVRFTTAATKHHDQNAS